ncbi:MAG TPA: methionine--tRNA ligase [Patescibacteria group bacterium]|nr:methionine--tRNA ligase [Patescibacteria group bacterium]
MPKKYYVTTPIYYVNDAPHIGSAYTTLAGDIIARYYRGKFGKENVFFLVGTDEHGQKIQTVAKEKGLTPIQLADKVSQEFKEAWKLLNIDYDFFIRTTDPRHEKIVSELLQKVYDAGYIYSGIYEGPYCIGCERFYKESELVDGRCPLHPNKEISYQKEKNYFLKLKELVNDKVLPKLKSAEYNILPEERKNEILSRIEQGIEDVSVSREGVTWGIPLPWDKSQTIYVWVDALINYFSATKFLEDKEKFWPADLHLMAKDILWFHAVIWEALLIAAGEKIPDTVFAHGFFTIYGQKMSKSLGNVITPKQLVDKYGVDGARYLMISAVSFGSDGNISLKSFDTKFNSDLANGLGNVVARIAKLSEKVDVFTEYKPAFTKEYIKDVEEFKLDQVIGIVQTEIKSLDEMINKTEPWNIKDETKLKDFLQICVDRIRQIGFELKPFLPETAQKIENQFKGPKIKSEAPLFPRLR